MTDAPPSLRPLERLRLVAAPGRIAFRDPLGVAPDAVDRPVVLEPAAWAIARRFDGRRSVARIAAEAAAELGRAIADEQVRELWERLSAGLLLADARFEAALERAFDPFRRQTRRPAVGAGAEYHADPFELRMWVGGIVADDWDLPPLAAAQGLLVPAARLASARPLHSRGWASVRHTAAELRRVVVLANAGAPYAEPLIPLSKPFDLPLGAVEPDREALAALDVLPGRLQLAHGPAVAIECALLFVRLLFPRVPVLALLASSLDAEDADAAAERAHASLERVLALEGRTLLVAAADLVRIGAIAPEPASATGSELRDHDTIALDFAAALDHAAFRAHALESGDPARAAAAAAPYHLLRALGDRPSLAPETSGSPTVQGSLLGYMESAAPGGLATACAMVFH